MGTERFNQLLREGALHDPWMPSQTTIREEKGRGEGEG